MCRRRHLPCLLLAVLATTLVVVAQPEDLQHRRKLQAASLSLASGTSYTFANTLDLR